jgi:hypothetical protein
MGEGNMGDCGGIVEFAVVLRGREFDRGGIVVKTSDETISNFDSND